MGIFGSDKPWYGLGLAFECTQCGRCCAGPEEGYIWVNKEEIAAIADFLGITREHMQSRYVRRVGMRQTLIERRPSNDCIFLERRADGGRGCQIYTVRPRQCRAWPFWPSNLSSPEAWALAQLRCPGMNRGRVYSRDEIEEKQKSVSR